MATTFTIAPDGSCTTPLTVTPADQPTVAAVSGGGQSSAPGTAFAAPLVAAITDRYGNAKPGAPVTFTVTSGPAAFGTAQSASVLADGTATRRRPLTGTRPGTVTVTAVSGDATATFTDTVVTPTAELSVPLTAPEYVRPGARLKVTATVANRGPDAAGGLRCRGCDTARVPPDRSRLWHPARLGCCLRRAERSCREPSPVPNAEADRPVQDRATSVTKDPNTRNNTGSAVVRVV